MSIDGKKMSCDYSTMARVLGEITLISMLSLAWAKTAGKKNRVKPTQLVGSGALKNRGAVVVIMAATITIDFAEILDLNNSIVHGIPSVTYRDFG